MFKFFNKKDGDNDKENNGAPDCVKGPYEISLDAIPELKAFMNCKLIQFLEHYGSRATDKAKYYLAEDVPVDKAHAAVLEAYKEYLACRHDLVRAHLKNIAVVNALTEVISDNLGDFTLGIVEQEKGEQ